MSSVKGYPGCQSRVMHPNPNNLHSRSKHKRSQCEVALQTLKGNHLRSCRHDLRQRKIKQVDEGRVLKIMEKNDGLIERLRRFGRHTEYNDGNKWEAAGKLDGGLKIQSKKGDYYRLRLGGSIDEEKFSVLIKSEVEWNVDEKVLKVPVLSLWDDIDENITKVREGSLRGSERSSVRSSNARSIRSDTEWNIEQEYPKRIIARPYETIVERGTSKSIPTPISTSSIPYPTFMLRERREDTKYLDEADGVMELRDGK